MYFLLHKSGQVHFSYLDNMAAFLLRMIQCTDK